MDKIYHSILWFLGFHTDEHISDMLARQRQRLGKWWWAFPILTLLMILALFAVGIWLTIHIAFYKPRE